MYKLNHRPTSCPVGIREGIGPQQPWLVIKAVLWIVDTETPCQPVHVLQDKPPPHPGAPLLKGAVHMSKFSSHSPEMVTSQI